MICNGRSGLLLKPLVCLPVTPLPLQLLGETPVTARVQPASLKVIIPPPPVQETPEADSAADDSATADLPLEADDDIAGVNEEGNGAASQPDGAAGTSPLVEASAAVEDKPIVAHEPTKQDSKV